jgi:hypothetical protein
MDTVVPIQKTLHKNKSVHHSFMTSEPMRFPFLFLIRKDCITRFKILSIGHRSVCMPISADVSGGRDSHPLTTKAIQSAIVVLDKAIVL